MAVGHHLDSFWFCLFNQFEKAGLFFMTSKKPTRGRSRPARPSTNKSREVSVKLRPLPVLDNVIVNTKGREVLESLISGHASKFDWYGEGEYFLCREEALELLHLTAPIHYSGRFGEVILDYSQGAGWILKPGL